MTKTILVTGGAGFIGSHLCERLSIDPANEVISLDNYSTGSFNNHVAGVEYLTGSTQDISSLIKCKPEIVFHLGEYSRVEQSFDDVKKVWAFNTVGTFAVLDFCLSNKSKLIYAGSSTKFGDGGESRTQTPYAWTKASNAELILNYRDWFGLECAITYFYNVYGPREIRSGNYATLIGKFAEKMLLREPLTVVKPGTQTRNFTFVKDVVEGLVLVGDLGKGDNYGIGHSQTWSVLEIAEMFGGDIVFYPERQGNRMSGTLITQKTEALGWKAYTHLPDYINGLKKNGWAD